MPDRKAYMRSYMRQRRAEATSHAAAQAEERLREMTRQEVTALIQPLVVMFKPPCTSPDLLSTITG
jgi:hypothetical protein